MDYENLIAIDIHTHAEVSCRNPFDNYGEEYDRAADKYFKNGRRPTIAETVAYYREQKIGLVMFTVDSESQLGRRRIPNEEIAQAARENSDMMVAFASIDPHKGKMGAREARRLIEEEGIRGFKFHPTVQGYHPYDKMAWPIYEVIAEHQLPAIFHTGHSGIGSGMRCGGGLRLAYSNPMHLDDVAIDFPDMQIVMAHPSFPWQDEALSVATHKPNVWIDLSGWSPKYFPKQLVQYANTLLKDRVLFGSDYPLITPERWMKDFQEAGLQARGDARHPQGQRRAAIGPGQKSARCHAAGLTGQSYTFCSNRISVLRSVAVRRAVASCSSCAAVCSAWAVSAAPSGVRCTPMARPSLGWGRRSIRPRRSSAAIRPTMLGGSTLSVAHSWREVIPGLCATSDNTENSTTLSPYTAMRSMNSPITDNEARRAL